MRDPGSEIVDLPRGAGAGARPGPSRPTCPSRGHGPPAVRRGRADRLRQPGQDLQGRRPRGRRPAGTRPARRSGRDDRHRRRLGLRQVDAAEHPRRAGRALGRAGHRGRPRPRPAWAAASEPAIGAATIGFVWQQTARNLLPYLTAVENVEMPMILDGAAGPAAAHGARAARRMVGLGGARRPSARAALRRRAAARGDRRRARQCARGAPGRRADRRARHRDQRRDLRAPAADQRRARHDRRDRDPRPARVASRSSAPSPSATAGPRPRRCAGRRSPRRASTRSSPRSSPSSTGPAGSSCRAPTSRRWAWSGACGCASSTTTSASGRTPTTAGAGPMTSSERYRAPDRGGAMVGAPRA